jgi:hypothetical protein
MVFSAFRPVFKSQKARFNNRKRSDYAKFEALESRTLLSSTLFVTPGTPDATHFQTLQAALAVAVTGDTVILQPGFSTGSFITTNLSQMANAGATVIHTTAALDVGDIITIGTNTGGDVAERNLVTAVTAGSADDFIITLASPLTAAHNGSIVDASNGTQGPTLGLSTGITLTTQTGAVLPFNIEIWNSDAPTTLSQVNMGAFTLFVDGDGNTISNSALGNIVIRSGASGNVFQGNTFNITTGNGPTLDHANGTVLNGNTFNVTSPSAIGLTIQNSNSVVITNNIITTGAGGTGMVVSVADAQSTTVDIRDNVMTTTDGTGIMLTKSGLSSTLQARLQGNDFRNNAIGVRIIGDGVSAGNIDLGGGNTVLGTSTGNNNFSTFNSADATHFAIGLFNTNVGALVRAAGNTFSTMNPVGTVADAFNTTAAGGSGVVLATGGFSFDYIFANGTPNTISNTTFSGTLATFTCYLSHVAGDFKAAINWGDGTASLGTVGTNESGFTVSGDHTWTADGMYTVTVVIESVTGGTAVITDVADIAPTTPTRSISLLGLNITADQFATFTGTVASFTDNKADTTLSDYTANIAWSDGQVTTGTIVANNDGSFSITASRAFNAAGNLTATVNLSTTDGYHASAGLNVTVNPTRAITLQGANITGEQFQLFTGTVASFTDNKADTVPSDYTATIAWSDGQTTSGTIVVNATGGFSVSTTRILTTAGNLTATVTVATTDNLLTSNVRLDVTVYPRLITLQGINITTTQFEPFTGTVATFTDSSPGATAANYVATIAWSDGTISPATIVANNDGSFSINTNRSFLDDGTFTAIVTLGTTDTKITSAANVTATVLPRVLALTPTAITLAKASTFSGVVATFTDNLAGTLASSYAASIAWSDGVTTACTITANPDGGFSIKTSRNFSKTGTITGTLTISTTDGLFTGTADLSATVTNDNGKMPPGKFKKLNFLLRMCGLRHGRMMTHSCHH